MRNVRVSLKVEQRTRDIQTYQNVRAAAYRTLGLSLAGNGGARVARPPIFCAEEGGRLCERSAATAA